MLLLPEGRAVILKPPNILYKLQLLPPGYVWLVRKAIYGLREAPNLGSERTDMMTKLTFSSEGGVVLCDSLTDPQVIMFTCED